MKKFVYMTDVADKKRTARGSHNKRTHCGKGGAVRFPSDNLSRKELNAMNGEVRAYRLNDPMKWDEFNTLPDDLKKVYVDGMRNRFHASDVKIFEMFGIGQSKGSTHFRKLGLANGRGSHHGGFLKEDWLKWLNGIKTERTEEVQEEPVPVAENWGGEQDMNESEEMNQDIALDLKSKELLYRALGRIEGVACGCEETVKKCLLLSVLQISVALNMKTDEMEN